MTTRSFPGSHDPDADRLNTLLDAMRSGTRAPETSVRSDEAGELAGTASTFRTLDERAKAAAYASGTTIDSIWEDIMSAHVTTTPTPFTGAPSGRSTEINQRVHPVPPQQKNSLLQSLLSAAIVAIMIGGLISVAWNLRGNGGGDTPVEHARLAATLLDATPEASPTGEAWMAWIRGEECVAEPMSQEDSGEIMRNEPDESVISQRSYTVVGPADPDIANAVARTGREHEACNIARLTDEKRALESPAFIYISNTGATSYHTADERKMQDVGHGEELSAQVPAQDPAHYIAVTTSDVSEGLVTTFDPGNTVMLEDRRVAIPATKLFASEPEDPFYPGGIVIFTNESGEWLLDEMVPFCVGDCEAFWVQSGGGRIVYDGTPSATPMATPGG